MIQSVVVNFFDGENHVILFNTESGQWECEDMRQFPQLDLAIMHAHERRVQGVNEQHHRIGRG